MSNKGIAPLQPTTDVGQFRLLVGDTSYSDLCPAQPGYGDFGMFSDDEISLFLSSGESPEEAAYLAYLQLAGAAALEAKSVKDFDLSVDLTKRASELRAVAQMWRDRADALAGDIFEVFDLGNSPRCRPELAPCSRCNEVICSHGRLF